MRHSCGRLLLGIATITGPGSVPTYKRVGYVVHHTDELDNTGFLRVINNGWSRLFRRIKRLGFHLLDSMLFDILMLTMMQQLSCDDLAFEAELWVTQKTAVRVVVEADLTSVSARGC